MKFCKTCGTLYNDAMTECPKCAAAMPEEQAESKMSPEEASRLKKKHWIQLTIGVPVFIGVFYLFYMLIQSIKR